MEACDRLIDTQGPAILQSMIDLTLDGNQHAMARVSMGKVLIEKLLPTVKGPLVTINQRTRQTFQFTSHLGLPAEQATREAIEVNPAYLPAPAARALPPEPRQIDVATMTPSKKASYRAMPPGAIPTGTSPAIATDDEAQERVHVAESRPPQEGTPQPRVKW